MPYIDKKAREKFVDLQMIGLKCDSVGELNYCLTMICKGYLSQQGIIRYVKINDIVGALECAKAEFYAKVARPYEEIKEKENGSVY